ncbi:hypothetical protein CDAR_480431 [Caerostris darwini]|uniref:Uncharacterized protein n=1 Tax=Caerostris darwini TaxID=1538125 RepID=A0AAV4V0C9_9ARAC|nr:hypothetical protein CDAR_480431 [Caerostris darwini]
MSSEHVVSLSVEKFVKYLQMAWLFITSAGVEKEKKTDCKVPNDTDLSIPRFKRFSSSFSFPPSTPCSHYFPGDSLEFVIEISTED